MRTINIDTPVGAFTRKTNTAYSHAIVWNSPRAMEYFKSASTGGYKHVGGVHGRWFKDRGYAVTWHGSLGAAQRALKGGYKWDGSNDPVGIFEVRS